MHKSTVALVVTAFLLSGLLVPTGAASGDQLWADPAIVLGPHDGPNGEYATINGNGDLEIDLTTTGVNAGSVTVIRDVFYVHNHDDERVEIWFSHDEMDEVTLSINGESVQGEDNRIELSPDQQESVGITIDASARSPGDIVLSDFTIHASDPSQSQTSSVTQSTNLEDPGTPVPTSTPTPTPSTTTPTSTPTPTYTETPPGTPIVSGDDDVVFADGTDQSVEIRPLPVDAVTTLPGEGGPADPPRPVIDVVRAPRSLEEDEPLPTLETRTGSLVDVGATLTLTAERTVVGNVEAVQPDRRILRLVEVDVPPSREGQPAYVQLTISRETLIGADPADAKVARHTGDGWQLLETQVYESDQERVVLRGRTQSFGHFAVFANPAVDYEWELGQDRTVESISIDERFDEPGVKLVNLSVTDGLGRTTSAKYQIIANDRPEVTIEAVGPVSPGDPVRLRANVTNEVGNVTVTWHLPDGTKVVGPTVERTFETGEHPISVEVVDEYGETGGDTATLVVGVEPATGVVTIELSRLSLTIEERLVMAAITILLLIAALREWSARRRRTRAR